jgi:hypothetical protein
MHALASDEDQAALWVWRYDELVRAGYPPDVAAIIARRLVVDLHEACDLLRAGCPVDQALEILL